VTRTNAADAGAASVLPVLSERRGPVQVVTLNRPRRLNAVNKAMYDGLRAALEEAAGDDAVRAVVLTGAGRGFCAGADLKAHRDAPLTGAERQAYIQAGQVAHRALYSLPKPVVAAVNGHAVGAGLELALCADFLIVAEAARLRLPEVALGTMIGGGSSYTLPRRIGHARASELVLLGRFFTPREAVSWGLANRSAPAGDVLPAALEIAGRFSANAPVAARLAKWLLSQGESGDLEAAMERESAALAEVMATEDWKEGVAAFAEGRPPVYRGK